jgi:uncharacterized protein (TIGR03085 family)
MNWARHERLELADLFATVGPDAPTLCEGWKTRDLAAHLVIRERRPDAAAGILVKPLARHTQRVQDDVAEQPWEDLVGLVRGGPPAWSPSAWEPIDRAINTVEYFVHHEDVRRAQPGWAPRTLDTGFEGDLWSRLKLGARLLVRRSPVGLALQHTDGETVRAKSGEPVVTVTGPPSELTLFVYGRQAHARVDIDASADVADQLRAARLGL